MRSILGEADEADDGVCTDAEVLDEHMPVALEVTFRPEGHKDREGGVLELVVECIGGALEVLVVEKEGHAFPVSRAPPLVCEHIVFAELKVGLEGLKSCWHVRRHDIRPLFMRMGRHT